MTKQIGTQHKHEETGQEMSFWEHLEELRWHLVRSILAILILAVAAFLSKDLIFNHIILAPKSSEFITNRALCLMSEWLASVWQAFPSETLCIKDFSLKLINIKLAGQFLIHLYISIFAGLIVAFPYLIWELWRFIKPALYKSEQQYTRGAVFWSSFLFILGISFSYFIIVPMAVLFLGSYNVSSNVENQIALSSYIGTVVSLTFAVGIVFEMPILVYFLTKVGLLTPDFMRKNRKAMVVVVLIISAIITPADVFSQILVAIPLLFLYEISIMVSSRIYNKQQAEPEG